MAETGVTQMPVISRSDRTLVGMIGLSDLLTARGRSSKRSIVASACSARACVSACSGARRRRR